MDYADWICCLPQNEQAAMLLTFHYRTHTHARTSWSTDSLKFSENLQNLQIYWSHPLSLCIDPAHQNCKHKGVMSGQSLACAITFRKYAKPVITFLCANICAWSTLFIQPTSVSLHELKTSTPQTHAGKMFECLFVSDDNQANSGGGGGIAWGLKRLI